MLSDVSFTLQQSVSKYKFKIKDGDKEIEEDVEIDTEKQRQILGTRETLISFTISKR